MNQSIRLPGFVSFISSPAGRAVRIAAGLAMIAGGLAAQSTAGSVIVVVGLVPLGAGVFDICLLGPVLGASFSGKEIRAALHQQTRRIRDTAYGR